MTAHADRFRARARALATETPIEALIRRALRAEGARIDTHIRTAVPDWTSGTAAKAATTRRQTAMTDRTPTPHSAQHAATLVLAEITAREMNARHALDWAVTRTGALEGRPIPDGTVEERDAQMDAWVTALAMTDRRWTQPGYEVRTARVTITGVEVSISRLARTAARS